MHSIAKLILDLFLPLLVEGSGIQYQQGDLNAYKISDISSFNSPELIALSHRQALNIVITKVTMQQQFYL